MTFIIGETNFRRLCKWGHKRVDGVDDGFRGSALSRLKRAPKDFNVNTRILIVRRLLFTSTKMSVLSEIPIVLSLPFLKLNMNFESEFIDGAHVQKKII